MSGIIDKIFESLLFTSVSLIVIYVFGIISSVCVHKDITVMSDRELTIRIFIYGVMVIGMFYLGLEVGNLIF